MHSSVSQGSVLGSILFISFVNDLANILFTPRVLLQTRESGMLSPRTATRTFVLPWSVDFLSSIPSYIPKDHA